MKASLPNEYISNGRNYGGEKETLSSYILAGINPTNNDLDELAVLRIYAGRSKGASRIYASVWVHNKCAGTGWAGGYGYHKPSAAAMEALTNAGIKLDEPISGRGDRAIEDALNAVGVSLGYDTVRVFST